MYSNEAVPVVPVSGGGSGGDLFGGGGSWIFAFLIIAIIFGGGNFGNNRGNSGGGSDGGLNTVLPLIMSNGGGTGRSCASAVADGFALQNLQTGITGINNNVVSGFYGVDRGLCDVGRQISDCCCQTQSAIKDVRFDISNGLCGLNNSIQNLGRDIMDKQDSGVRAILDFLTNDKIESLRTENQALRFQASQVAQNQFITQVGSDIVNRLHPPAVPSYQVPNPYTGYGFGYGGNSCGCGC